MPGYISTNYEILIWFSYKISLLWEKHNSPTVWILHNSKKKKKGMKEILFWQEIGMQDRGILTLSKCIIVGN